MKDVVPLVSPFGADFWLIKIPVRHELCRPSGESRWNGSLADWFTLLLLVSHLQAAKNPRRNGFLGGGGQKTDPPITSPPPVLIGGRDLPCSVLQYRDAAGGVRVLFTTSRSAGDKQNHKSK